MRPNPRPFQRPGVEWCPPDKRTTSLRGSEGDTHLRQMAASTRVVATRGGASRGEGDRAAGYAPGDLLSLTSTATSTGSARAGGSSASAPARVLVNIEVMWLLRGLRQDFLDNRRDLAIDQRRKHLAKRRSARIDVRAYRRTGVEGVANSAFLLKERGACSKVGLAVCSAASSGMLWSPATSIFGGEGRALDSPGSADR
jgi:hypothetical protein